MSANDTVIEVADVSKRYRLNEFRPSLRHEGLQLLKRWLRLTPQAYWESQPFWALRHVNFTIRKGETVGIIGRNGAGKTTLLRLLSAITEPTEGTIVVKGRFATLIGVSAGFDYQRTGIENIYLNSAIYGIAPNDVDKIMKDIVEFSELGDFLKMPVKRYSSGMLARLGFSIAIHILPEIIFLDEVLAVGDMAFQEKCVARILRLKDNGCTILFVSHSSDSVRLVCDRALWLQHGELMLDGEADTVIKHYEASLVEPAAA